MAYSKQTWVRGEKVASTKLNHMEDGIDAISANGAIGTANLANASVTNAKLDQEAVDTDNIRNGAITTPLIYDGAVTAAKLGESATHIIADTFSTSTAYSVGDYVIYSGALYRFNADKTAGAWDSTKVVSVALADDVDDISSTAIVTDAGSVAFDTVQNGIAYNTDSTSGTTWRGANSYIKNVVSGEKYKITTTIVHSTKYYAVLYYNGNTFVSGEYQGNTTSATPIVDYEFTIPDGVNKIIVTTLASVTPSLMKCSLYAVSNKYVSNYVEYDGTTLKIKARYNKTEDVVIEMKKRGNNSLFDFDKVYTVARSIILNNTFTPLRSILTADTDCFSPHQCRARTNIDGDSTAYFLTGGNHDRSGVPTASCDNIRVYVDGEKVTNFSGLCTSVRVTWENHIQGHNTWKEDGTGRSILDELIEINVHGSKFDVIVKQIPTEDIYQSVYFGLMSINTPYTSLRYVGGSNRASIVRNASTNNGSKTCRRTIATNDSTGDSLETYIANEDLGNFSFTDVAYSAFTGNSKLYYAIMLDTTKSMNQGDLYCLIGFYNFYSVA